MIQYQEASKKIQTHGTPHEDRTGVGTISFFGEIQMVFDLANSFPIVTTKKVPLRWIFEELMWFLSGNTDNQSLLEKKVDIWNEWADEAHTSRFGREAGDLGPIYGYLWRSFGGHYPKKDGIDQIDWLIKEMQNNPNSRRLVVSGWDPGSQNLVDLPPCHTLFQFKIEQEKYLSCKLYQRSADFFLGVPFNISSYALLTVMLAHVMNLKPKKFIHTFGDAHIYTNHADQVEELLSREPKALPTLEIINADHLIGKGLDGLLDLKWENINLIGYDPHGKIAAPVAV